MGQSVAVELEFIALILFSLILPTGIFSYMMWKQVISRKSVLFFGGLLIVIAGVCVVLLQRLAELSQLSPSLADDRFFHSEISMALYLFPALFAGIGANLISHILTSHLRDAEKRYDRTRKQIKRLKHCSTV